MLWHVESFVKLVNHVEWLFAWLRIKFFNSVKLLALLLPSILRLALELLRVFIFRPFDSVCFEVDGDEFCDRREIYYVPNPTLLVELCFTVHYMDRKLVDLTLVVLGNLDLIEHLKSERHITKRGLTFQSSILDACVRLRGILLTTSVHQVKLVHEELGLNTADKVLLITKADVVLFSILFFSVLTL